MPHRRSHSFQVRRSRTYPSASIENPGNRNYPDPHVAAVIFPEAIKHLAAEVISRPSWQDPAASIPDEVLDIARDVLLAVRAFR